MTNRSRGETKVILGFPYASIDYNMLIKRSVLGSTCAPNLGNLYGTQGQLAKAQERCFEHLVSFFLHILQGGNAMSVQSVKYVGKTSSAA